MERGDIRLRMVLVRVHQDDGSAGLDRDWASEGGEEEGKERQARG